MATRVQIVIEVDADKAGAAVTAVKSAISGLGGTAVTTTREGSAGFNQMEGSILKAVAGAQLLERAVGAAGRALKSVIADSALLAARSEVLDRVMVQLAGTSGQNVRVLRAQVEELRALGIEQTQARQSVIQFMTAELDVADAIRIANIARDRAVIAGENTSDTMNRLTRAILAQEVELLKMVGIVIRQEDAFRRYGAEIGKSANELNEFERRQAFVNEILRFGEGSLGSYESAMEKVGKQLTTLPRLATEAGIAFGTGFQGELQIGVTALTDFLKFARENGQVLSDLTKAAFGAAAAFTALTLAMNVASGSGIVGFLGTVTRALGLTSGAVTALSTALLGGSGVVGLAGAWGLLAAAGVALGFGIHQVVTAIQNHNEIAKVAAFDVESWRERLEAAGVTVRDNAQAMTILERVSAANNNLREAGLPPLRITADLMDRLAEAERRFASAAGDSTIELAKRQQQLESFREKLEQRSFRAGLEGLGPEQRILAQSAEEIRKIQEQLRELPEAAVAAQAAIEGINRETAAKIGELREKESTAAVEAALEVIDKQVDAIARIEDRREGELARFRELAARFPALREIFGQAEIAAVANAEAEITKIRGDEFRKQAEAAQDLADKRIAIAESIAAVERANALGAASPLQRVELERIQQLEEFEARLGKAVEDRVLSQAEALEQLRRAETAINESAGIAMRGENERIFDEQARLIERNSRQFELFWDRVIRGAKSTGDFLSNLWNEMANQFRRMVLQSVASWLFGQRQIGAAGAGGLGAAGGFAGLLGGIFGTPGAASARTPPFVSSFLSGGGLGAGSAGGGLPGVGGAGAAGAGIPLGIPGLGSAGIPGLGGGGLLGGGGGGVPAALGLLLGLEGARRGRPGLAAGLGVGGVLGGVALSGAAAGIAGGIGGLAGAGVGLAGFLTNPIGLAILGGVAGVAAIVGIVQRGRKKEDASAIANDGFAQITELVARYSSHAATFDSTITAMNRIWSQMESAWRQIGGSVGSNSITDQRRYFDAHVKQVQDIERERARRGDLISNLPTPQFATGGLVGPLGGVVDPGEFVLRREAVQQTGVPMLQRINEGAPAAGGDVINIEIHTPDKHGVEELIRGNWDLFKRAIVSMTRQSRGEFGLR